MEKYESEQTRRYLLNSHSRGSLEEIISEKDDVLCGDEEDYTSSEEHLSNRQFMKEWEGRSETHAYFRQSYE